MVVSGMLRALSRPGILRMAVARRAMSTLPAHEVLTMPALSPTMERGTIAGWSIQEGGEISAGSPICEIETDKATVDFEAQDDGFLAKILLPAGAQDVPVGTPIGVSVEDAADVAAFASTTVADFGGSAAGATAAKEEAPATPEPPAAAAPPPPPTPPPTPAPARPAVEPAAPPTPQPAGVQASAGPRFPAMKSPLKPVLDASVKQFEADFGHTLMTRPKPTQETDA